MIFLKSDNSSSVHGFDFVDKSKFFGSLMSPICSGVKRCIVSLFQLTNLPKNRDIFKFANWQLFTANCYCSSSATASATAELLFSNNPTADCPLPILHRQLQTLNCQLLLPLSITQLPLLLPLSNNPTHHSPPRYFTRSTYSPVRVSTFTLSPWFTKRGTFISTPFSVVADFSAPDEVSPFTAGSA